MTRIPCWTALELNAERGFKLRSTSVEKRREAGACLTIVGDKTPWNPAHESEFERTIRQAVADTGGSITFSGIELSGKPHLIKASEAFSTPLNHSTVVDVTDLEHAVMILLGVRAAVRRGVTITVSRTAASPDFWAMPYGGPFSVLWIGRVGDQT